MIEKLLGGLSLIDNHKLLAQSINRSLSAIRSYLKYLIEMDLPTPLAPEAIKLLKTTKKHARVAELDDLIKLIESPIKLEKSKLIGLCNRTMLELLFSTGMRISELINLKVDKIDNSGKIFILGKGKKERFVYMTVRAEEHLKNYLRQRHSNSAYIFIPYRGLNTHVKDKKISTNYLQMKIKYYKELL